MNMKCLTKIKKNMLPPHKNLNLDKSVSFNCFWKQVFFPAFVKKNVRYNELTKNFIKKNN